MPTLRRLVPSPVFHVVGANPGRNVKALGAEQDVRVTGRVDDVRPYIAHADVVVAPLRLARGVQNKVLEAMAMAKPVVASRQAFEGIRARAGADLLVANDAVEMAICLSGVLEGRHPGLGEAARRAMEQAHDWSRTLQHLDTMLHGFSRAEQGRG
jgi:glycosyltransferase involved in cell wall biosynthesis